MKKQKLIALAGGFCLIVLVTAWAAPAPAAEAVIQWRLQHMFPAGCFDAEFTQNFCDYVWKASGERLKITKYGMGTLAPATEMLSAVGARVFEMGYTGSAYHAGKIPEAILGFTLPFLYRDLMETIIVSNKVGIKDILRESYQQHNVYLLSLGPLSHVEIFSKVPIRKVADFKGVKMRASGMAGDVLRKIGAVPTFVPGPEIYQGLEKGVLDAALWGDTNTNIDLGFPEVTKYEIHPTTITIGDIYVNMDAWKALPDDLKVTLELAADKFGVDFCTKSVFMIPSARRKLVDKYGFELITLPESELVKAREYSMAVLDDYAKKSPRAERIVKALKEYFATR